jgi:TolB protein
MPHSQGLVLSAQEQLGGPTQLWYLAYPSGELERITNDLNNYNGVSVSADGNTMATVQRQISSSVWLAPNASAETAFKLTSGTNEGSAGVALMRDGRVLYTVSGVGTSDLFVVNPDGSNPRQLTSNAALNVLPVVSTDGRYIVFVSTRTGVPHIWRMDSDGSNLKQITNGIAETNPIVSPDSQWIVYQDINDLRMWKIPIDGGTAAKLLDKLVGQAAISPDGKLIACRFREEDLSPFKLGVISFATGEIVKAIDVPVIRSNLVWTPDSRAVLYMDALGGVSNIWSQPIDGGPAKQVTQFKSDLIFTFDVSSDGKQMVLTRGNVSDNVVLIADVKS